MLQNGWAVPPPRVGQSPSPSQIVEQAPNPSMAHSPAGKHHVMHAFSSARHWGSPK
jgi:hypothetical protein